jgi:hypothetical protein
MDMMLKHRCNHRSERENGQKKKKSTYELVKDQGVFGCVFLFERHCPSRICTTWSDSNQRVVAESFSAFEGFLAQEEAYMVGKTDLDVAPLQVNGSRLAPHYLAKH